MTAKEIIQNRIYRISDKIKSAEEDPHITSTYREIALHRMYGVLAELEAVRDLLDETTE